ncbi:prolyl oligopeptidase family serine peptidase [Sphingomonas sp. SFZ2018-12]|uniref:prolyl oligopeptidase family serine peptidase n=1 Tax=Sphingomonas sp. SFZ2018-12 TaxID=2683197 RepID=UPI001F0FD347|nr:prolyl oligopeptidase family serine peptidase [Sphingomonas sp. SFZ2018-12]MCH4894553.1 prolyl oligopeptidase family serine peptidase [Sphingomonas sp. SFZ2018-12]
MWLYFRRRPLTAFLSALFIFGAHSETNAETNRAEANARIVAVGGSILEVRSGNTLVRHDGARSGEVVFSTPDTPDGLPQVIKRLTCDSKAVDRCIVGYAPPGSDRARWRSLDLATGRSIPGWPEIGITNATLEAVSFSGGIAVWSATALSERKPGDLPSGLYVTKAGGPPTVAGRVRMTDDGQLPRGWFVQMDGGHHILVADKELSLLDVTGRTLFAGFGTDGFVTAHGTTAFAISRADLRSRSGRVLPAGSLLHLPFTTALGGTTGWSPMYVADVHGPPLRSQHTRRELNDVGASLAFFGGRALAVADQAGHTRLVELCRQSGDLTAVTVRELGDDAAAIGLMAGAGAEGILNVARPDGQLAQWVIRFESERTGADPFAPCGERAPTLNQASTGTKTQTQERRGPAIVRHEARAPDGQTVSYAVLGDPSQGGRALVRAYGAYGEPAREWLTNSLEKAWIEQGGVVIVPVLRGDGGRDAAWAAQGRGNLKTRTVDDLLAVVEDVRRRGIGGGGLVTVSGASAGAFVAAKAALRRPDLFRAAVLLSGALDLQVLAAGRDPNLAEFGSAEGGFPRWYGGVRAPAKQAPIFILVHDKGDERTLLANSQNFQVYAQSLGYRAGLLTTEGASHGDIDAPALTQVIMEQIGSPR